MSPSIRRITAIAIAGATIVAGAASANAQIPGANDTGMVVVTDSNALTVKVIPAGASATAISGTITNNTGTTFRCYTPGVSNLRYPGQVTEAGIVAESMNYYAHNIYVPIGGMTPPVTGVTLDPIPIGSMYDIMPTGSFNKVMGGSSSGQLTIRGMQEDARVAGHTGDPLVNGRADFDVPARGTVNWTANLSTPPTGVRTDFDAAAMFFCTDTSNQRPHVFAGYETGAAPGLLP